MISNAEYLNVAHGEAFGNGEYGVLLQGRYGANHCTFHNFRVEDNPVNYKQLHASRMNWINRRPSSAGPEDIRLVNNKTLLLGTKRGAPRVGKS